MCRGTGGGAAGGAAEGETFYNVFFLLKLALSFWVILVHITPMSVICSFMIFFFFFITLYIFS